MHSPKDPRAEVMDSAHTELLGRNMFMVAMVGAVAFVGACFLVILH